MIMWQVTAVDEFGITDRRRVCAETVVAAIEIAQQERYWDSLSGEPPLLGSVQATDARVVDPYRDDIHKPRRCDHCDQIYRGPAVYCSLGCALADA